MDLLYGDVARLGKIFGKESAADDLIKGWKKQLDTIKVKVGTNNNTRYFLYFRRGGDLPGFWHGSSFACPDYAGINKLIKAVFIESTGGQVLNNRAPNQVSNSYVLS